MVAEGSLVEAAEEMHLKAGDGAVSMRPFCLHVSDPLLA